MAAHVVLKRNPPVLGGTFLDVRLLTGFWTAFWYFRGGDFLFTDTAVERALRLVGFACSPTTITVLAIFRTGPRETDALDQRQPAVRLPSSSNDRGLAAAGAGGF